MKKEHQSKVLGLISRLCTIAGVVLCIGPGLGSEREAVYWMLGGCALLLAGGILSWLDSRRRLKGKMESPAKPERA